MSPELFNPNHIDFKKGRPTKESDYYALGMVIYEVISGQPPFAKVESPIVMLKVIEGKCPERPEGIEGTWFTDDVWGTLNLCWATKPGDRPSIGVVLECLEPAAKAWKPPPPQADEEVETDEYDWDLSTREIYYDS